MRLIFNSFKNVAMWSCISVQEYLKPFTVTQLVDTEALSVFQAADDTNQKFTITLHKPRILCIRQGSYEISYTGPLESPENMRVWMPFTKHMNTIQYFYQATCNFIRTPCSSDCEFYINDALEYVMNAPITDRIKKKLCNALYTGDYNMIRKLAESYNINTLKSHSGYFVHCSETTMRDIETVRWCVNRIADIRGE